MTPVPTLKDIQRMLVEATVVAVKEPKKVVDSLKEIEAAVNAMIEDDEKTIRAIEQAEREADEEAKKRQERLNRLYDEEKEALLFSRD